MDRIVILQPLIPHYRKFFFERINRLYHCDYYCYEDNKKLAKGIFKKSNTKVKFIKNLAIGPFLVYNPFKFLDSDTKILVLMLHIGHITTWLLLITKFIHKKKIVLWGHGISVKRYVYERHLADRVWVYTQKEKNIWNLHITNSDKITALNNTISEIGDIVNYQSISSKAELKEKYKVNEIKICIFSARFTLEERRADLLERIIQSCGDIGFIIIGDGPLKPDFSIYSNVYDMGAIYDAEIKNELFSIADIYLQPAWLGLSVVEAMAYGLPIFTLRRTVEIKQCVEYFYLEESGGGKIFDTVELLIENLHIVEQKEMVLLGTIARQYVKNYLMMSNMVNNAIASLKSLDR